MTTGHLDIRLAGTGGSIPPSQTQPQNTSSGLFTTTPQREGANPAPPSITTNPDGSTGTSIATIANGGGDTPGLSDTGGSSTTDNPPSHSTPPGVPTNSMVGDPAAIAHARALALASADRDGSIKPVALPPIEKDFKADPLEDGKPSSTTSPAVHVHVIRAPA